MAYLDQRTLRRAVLALGALALSWALGVAITGGFFVRVAGISVSSRAPLNPAIVALVAALVYCIRWRPHWRTDVEPVTRLGAARAVAALAVLVTLAAGLGWGTRIAGGPDASGYVSAAALYLRGRLTVPCPEWMNDATWNNAGLTAAPVGWRPTSQTPILAPTYPPGLPLLMALFQLVGGAGAVFYVVPLLGAIAVGACAALGSRIGGPWAGAVAAMLVASSPPFLSNLLQPMSDVPAMAFWTLALLATWRRGYTGAALAGAAICAAVLIRPNLVPLALVVALLLLLQHETRIRRVLLFGAIAAPSAIAFAALNYYYYKTLASSGYGPIQGLYSAAAVIPNLAHYGRWLTRSQTPLLLAGMLAPLTQSSTIERARVALVTIAVPALNLVLYLPYLTFHDHEWQYLRFLLPAYPVLAAGLGTAVVHWCRHARRPGVARALASGAVLLLLWHGWTYARNEHVFEQRRSDDRYARAVEYVKKLPPRSVILSLAHSGTLRHYAGIDVLRFEALEQQYLDQAVSYLRQRGYHLYLLGDQFEIDMFRAQFEGTSTLTMMNTATPIGFRGVVVYPLGIVEPLPIP